jgi:hypothetical protein
MTMIIIDDRPIKAPKFPMDMMRPLIEKARDSGKEEALAKRLDQLASAAWLSFGATLDPDTLEEMVDEYGEYFEFEHGGSAPYMKSVYKVLKDTATMLRLPDVTDDDDSPGRNATWAEVEQEHLENTIVPDRQCAWLERSLRKRLRKARDEGYDPQDRSRCGRKDLTIIIHTSM